MSLAGLVYPPPTPRGLDEWAWHHYNHHLAIINAVKAKQGFTLPVLQIWPLDPLDIRTWLEQHQDMHNQMNGVFHNIGNDISSFNWQNDREREGFFFLNFQEHRAAAADCGFSI